MLDTYVLPLSLDEPTTLEESLALLEHEIDEVSDAVFPGLSGYDLTLDPWEAISEIEELLRTGRLTGFVAYVGGFPAGLCLFGAPPAELPRVRQAASEHVPVVACLLVGPAYRRLGLDRVLLAEAEGAMAAEGLAFVEAYPPKTRPGARDTGPLRTFLAAGFVPVGELGPRLVVRKTLCKARARKVG